MNDNDTSGDMDIFAVDRTDSGWGAPFSLFGDKDQSEDRFACSIDSSGTMYYYAKSSRGTGGYDLYRVRLVDGAYSQPVLLGEPVNTKNDETCPCIARDGSFTYLRDAIPDPDMNEFFRSAGNRPGQASAQMSPP